MKIHVLAGDSLIETFKQANIEGEIVICRECLIEGELESENLDEFWKIRANFIARSYGDSERENYQQKVVGEFKKIQNLNVQDEVNLWFEYELFCQTNMWFCLYLLRQTQAEVYRVEPMVRVENDIWRGFGKLSKEDLQKCFAARTKFSEEDLLLGANLWTAYQNKDYAKLVELSRVESKCFPKLKVCAAEIEKRERPRKTLREIIANGETNFSAIFKRFNDTEGVYGFGDSQVERIYKEIIQ
jgi:hypothetical protein